MAQLIQLESAGVEPDLRVTGTLEALDAAGRLGLITDEDRQVITDAWVLASRVRNAATLVTAKSVDQVPTDRGASRGTGYLLGYAPDQLSTMREDYLRTTRRARGVTERLFYGEPDQGADYEFV